MENTIKIQSIQANSLYVVNTYKESGKVDNFKPYLDLGEAVINNSLFSDYMIHHGVAVNKKGHSKDFIVMKFKYGVKDGMSAQELRKYYYKNGAKVTWELYDKEGNVRKTDTIHYKMLMRSPGKAKEGDCIFIRENLYSIAIKYITMDLWDKMPTENAKIVEMSAYAPLTTATAIDYITIPMENILIVEDEKVSAMIQAVTVKTHDVPYEKEVIDWRTAEDYINEYGFTFYKKKSKDNPSFKYIEKKRTALRNNGIKIEELPVKKEVYYRKECYVDRAESKSKVENILWDGMGLADDSIFPGNDMEGFIYCRSHFFKSCLFRGNIQDYFKDFYGDKYNTATVTDMFGNIFKVTDIKVIITENSIKWIKFADIMGKTDRAAYNYYRRYMKKHSDRFAIVKTAHRSKWGELQQSSYQINNSFPCTDKDVLYNIAKKSIDYCNSLKTDHKAFIKHLSINTSLRYNITNVLIALDKYNDNFKYTQYFKTKRKEIISKFKNDRLKGGKLLQSGDNLTIMGNPIALLKKVTGEDCLQEGCFEIISNGIQCYTTRFKNGERLAGFRHPHNAPSNIINLINIRSKKIQRYFPKLGDNVIIINGLGTDVQSRLNGQDLDSDMIYTTNQPDIVNIAEQAYCNYPTIINEISLSKTSTYKKDMESYAKMDNTIASAQFAIGHASNIAQLALSYYYDSGCRIQELEDVFIICSVLAQVAIDSAKRTYKVGINSELRRLSNLSCMQRIDGKIYPKFYAHIQRRIKNNSNIQASEIGRFNCPMEILAEIIEENVMDLRQNKEYILPTCNLSTVFQYEAGRARDSKQYKKVLAIVQQYDREVRAIDISDSNYSRKVSLKFDSCLGRLKNLSINKYTMSALIDYAFKANRDVRDRLLTVLYDKDSDTFLSCFKNDTKVPQKHREAI